jgi:hypothetical protein
MKVNLLLLLAALVNAAAQTAIETSPVNLGTACNYVILAKSGISTVPTSAITGNIAVSPIAATAMTGFGLSLDLGGQFSTATQFTGQAFAASYGGATAAALTVAVLDMQTAYTDAAGRPNADTTRINVGAGDISGLTLTPGVYTFQVGISFSADIYFDADGDSDAVFLLQTTGNLIQAANINVILQGGARAENIYWQVAGYVNVGVGAAMKGILLSKTAVTFMTGSSLDGLIFAQTACVLQMATISQADGTCGISAEPSGGGGQALAGPGEAFATATITVTATTTDPSTDTTTTTSTTITQTKKVNASETTKTTSTTLATTTSVLGGTPVTITDEQEPIVEVSEGSESTAPIATATVTGVEGTAQNIATATATATAIASLVAAAEAKAEATSVVGPASTATSTATTTATRTIGASTSLADTSNTDEDTEPTAEIAITGIETAAAEAIATETASSTATSTSTEE